MNMIEEIERRRFANMTTYKSYCKCPECKKIDYPLFTRHEYGFSGIYYCFFCRKGNAAYKWIEYGTANQLAMQKIKEMES